MMLQFIRSLKVVGQSADKSAMCYHLSCKSNTDKVVVLAVFTCM